MKDGALVESTTCLSPGWDCVDPPVIVDPPVPDCPCPIVAMLPPDYFFCPKDDIMVMEKEEPNPCGPPCSVPYYACGDGSDPVERIECCSAIGRRIVHPD